MGKIKFKLLAMFLSLAVLFSPTAVFAEKEIIDVSREEVICRRYLSDVLIITTLPEYSLKMPDYERFGLRRPWWDYRNAIKEIRLDMFKSMNYRTFRDFRRLEIADLSKATELEDLGQETFLRCDKLAFLFLPETFKEKFYSINGKVASEEECRKYYAINKHCKIKFGDLRRYTEKLEVENGILLQKYTEELIDKNNTLIKIKSKVEMLEKEISALKQKDGEQQKKIDGLQAENVNLKKEIANSNQSITSSKNTLNAFDKKLTEQQSKYSQENAGLRQEISALKQKDGEQQKKIDNLQAENGNLKKGMTNLQTTLEGKINNAVAGQNTKNDNLNREISGLKQKDGEQQKKIDSLQAENGNRKKEIAALNQRDAGNQAKISELQKANSTSKQEIASLKQKSAKYGDILENTAAGYHNSIFRGKDITRYYNDGSLYTRISSGEFEDLFVGDYIVKNGVTWRIAGFDIILNKGKNATTTKHHACIVPDTKLATAPMNSTNTTHGGYVGSEMYKTTLNNVFSNSIKPVFGDHVITYSALLTKSMDPNLINRLGRTDSWRGGSDGDTWYDRRLDLMNENQVYGSIVWSSTGFETGSDNVQLPLFRLAPEFINKERHWYWLRNVVSAFEFARVYAGDCSDGLASYAGGGVRPCFYID